MSLLKININESMNSSYRAVKKKKAPVPIAPAAIAPVASQSKTDKLLVQIGSSYDADGKEAYKLYVEVVCNLPAD